MNLFSFLINYIRHLIFISSFTFEQIPGLYELSLSVGDGDVRFFRLQDDSGDTAKPHVQHVVSEIQRRRWFQLPLVRLWHIPAHDVERIQILLGWESILQLLLLLVGRTQNKAVERSAELTLAQHCREVSSL